ncbi:tyrosine-type recombinase/integrase [Bradyrhizobium sp. USDA 313]|uniref:tyrosine-type recombinase/integrase n=1 Tax=Bradyrhizobium sp. USDA 313 TaxID=3156307 RepID=UPI00351166DE
MPNITSTKRERKNLTKALCEARVTRQTKYYDKQVAGLYVSVTPKGAVFNLKYTDPATRKRGSLKIGVYHPETFNVDHARREAYLLKARIGRGEDIAQSARQVRELHAKLSGVTVDQIIDERIAWASALVPKGRDKDGVKLKMGPRKKDWANMASHLNRFVRPRLGKMIASEVTKHDIARLQADILAGTLIIKKGKTTKKGSISSARHMRKAVSGLFNWAAEAGRDYVSSSPCVNLPPLDREPPRTRKLSPDEIRTLWQGLDRPGITVDRRICLAIKFALVSMLRSVELLHIHRDELVGGLSCEKPLVVIPEERVKAGREICQPLSDLAVEIAMEAMGNHQWMFMGRFEDGPLNRKSMACALRGNTVRRGGKLVVRSIGLCAQLAIKPFTPHDLRRTAASLMGSLKVPRSVISMCLDHTVNGDEHGEVSAVTGRHYDQDPRIEEKREALQILADEIRRIVSTPAHQEHKLAA